MDPCNVSSADSTNFTTNADPELDSEDEREIEDITTNKRHECDAFGETQSSDDDASSTSEDGEEHQFPIPPQHIHPASSTRPTLVSSITPTPPAAPSFEFIPPTIPNPNNNLSPTPTPPITGYISLRRTLASPISVIRRCHQPPTTPDVTPPTHNTPLPPPRPPPLTIKQHLAHFISEQQAASSRNLAAFAEVQESVHVTECGSRDTTRVPSGDAKPGLHCYHPSAPGKVTVETAEEMEAKKQLIRFMEEQAMALQRNAEAFASVVATAPHSPSPTATTTPTPSPTESSPPPSRTQSPTRNRTRASTPIPKPSSTQTRTPVEDLVLAGEFQVQYTARPTPQTRSTSSVISIRSRNTSMEALCCCDRPACHIAQSGAAPPPEFLHCALDGNHNHSDNHNDNHNDNDNRGDDNDNGDPDGPDNPANERIERIDPQFSSYKQLPSAPPGPECLSMAAALPKGQTPEEGHIVKELKLDEEARKAWRKDEELTGGETWGNRGIAGWDTEGNEDQKEEEEEEGEVAGNEKGKKVVVVKQETVQEAILRQILETERRLVEQAKGQKNPAPAGKSSTKVGAGAAPLKPATLVAQPGKAGSATAEKAAISNPAAAATVQAKPAPSSTGKVKRSPAAPSKPASTRKGKPVGTSSNCTATNSPATTHPPRQCTAVTAPESQSTTPSATSSHSTAQSAAQLQKGARRTEKASEGVRKGVHEAAKIRNEVLLERVLEAEKKLQAEAAVQQQQGRPGKDKRARQCTTNKTDSNVAATTTKKGSAIKNSIPSPTGGASKQDTRSKSVDIANPISPSQNTSNIPAPTPRSTYIVPKTIPDMKARLVALKAEKAELVQQKLDFDSLIAEARKKNFTQARKEQLVWRRCKLNVTERKKNGEEVFLKKTIATLHKIAELEAKLAADMSAAGYVDVGGKILHVSEMEGYSGGSSREAGRGMGPEKSTTSAETTLKIPITKQARFEHANNKENKSSCPETSASSTKVPVTDSASKQKYSDCAAKLTTINENIKKLHIAKERGKKKEHELVHSQANPTTTQPTASITTPVEAPVFNADGLTPAFFERKARYAKVTATIVPLTKAGFTSSPKPTSPHRVSSQKLPPAVFPLRLAFPQKPLLRDPRYPHIAPEKLPGYFHTVHYSVCALIRWHFRQRYVKSMMCMLPQGLCDFLAAGRSVLIGLQNLSDVVTSDDMGAWYAEERLAHLGPLLRWFDEEETPGSTTTSRAYPFSPPGPVVRYPGRARLRRPIATTLAPGEEVIELVEIKYIEDVFVNDGLEKEEENVRWKKVGGMIDFRGYLYGIIARAARIERHRNGSG